MKSLTRFEEEILEITHFNVRSKSARNSRNIHKTYFKGYKNVQKWKVHFNKEVFGKLDSDESTKIDKTLIGLATSDIVKHICSRIQHDEDVQKARIKYLRSHKKHKTTEKVKCRSPSPVK